MAGFVARFPHRPSDILGLKGTMLERLLLDVDILTTVMEPPTLSSRIQAQRLEWPHWEEYVK